MDSKLQMLEMGLLRAVRSVAYVVALMGVLTLIVGCFATLIAIFYGKWEVMWLGLAGWCLLGPVGWCVGRMTIEWSWEEQDKLTYQTKQ